MPRPDPTRTAGSDPEAFSLPKSHRPVMHRPPGGDFTCASCAHVSQDRRSCGEPHFVRWNGGNRLPFPADQMCSDWFEPRKT